MVTESVAILVVGAGVVERVTKRVVGLGEEDLVTNFVVGLEERVTDTVPDLVASPPTVLPERHDQ